ncbi:fused 3-hydroxybutyryl-CoA epimerase, delta(3)-cis-delta(2)-trans-enoyl-CoA isomerase, enoyl-CoA hydratase, 3-hydroxyacyl-CoA dehydrogenase [Magnetospirillum sp. XM-1]|uniref:3-hydroxyacyl-CoA dehydrogenase NAD-binding domain-containing protein n=1 Tax=Magnetospirillum sp. XM-1 TaxID=1663591 RepID=UPI00073DD2CB|nr:3-hydroxyacyl-CoA dehydrogenase NAD-binding domain-containing protein [Magnetospirillum sp. XM-1]CUW40946.1 fused 3-hydroxybutyryl-CoA epimerase, delta(3)-cis-delta(2)-trans-enoyl-CoA isomerase, enoyl-CoA hydratase, 3-hydroxyacyl-CoA dehydrogenase [Magnetospirillum sp. XM-1]
MSDVVTLSVSDRIATVTIDSPPVNAADHPVRAGLQKAFNDLAGRSDFDAVVVICAGRTFMAGADIGEFDTGIKAPHHQDLFNLVEACAKPVVAALHGTALGAGTELAMACHYRVADKGARIGLPELSLGIIPGAGGTQRAPRLIGLDAAMDLVLSGKPAPAAKALELGLVDEVVASDVNAAALAFTKKLVAEGKGVRRTCDMTPKDAAKAAEIIAARQAQVAKTMRNRTSPLKALEAMAAAATLSFAEGLKLEADISKQLEHAVEARAMRHLFFADREVRKIPGITKDIKARPIRKVGIIGAGTMGGGIAMCFANIGVPVTIIDVSTENLDRGFAVIRKNYERSVSRGSLTQEQLEGRMALLTPSTDYAALKDADLAIEAVFEKMELKKDIFTKLDAVLPAGAILGTNTSTLDIDEIANITKRPADVIGLHFFSPANVMPLLEIVQGAKTSMDVLLTALDMAKLIKKTGVVSKVCYGFIGNRMMDPYGREAERMVLEGATPVEIDGALEEWGMAMGILAVYDMAGVEVGDNTRIANPHMVPDDPSFYRCSSLLVANKWLGQKVGRGYYRYDGGKRASCPEVIEMMHAEGKRLNVPARKPGKQEILERCLYSMINEGAKLLEEGIALRASDIDVVYTAGYGFPRYRGGPMFYADTVGLKVIYDKIVEFGKTLDPRYWTPAPLLEKLAKAGSTFAQWDASQGK